MNVQGLWSNSLFQQTAGIIMGALILVAILLFLTRNKANASMAGWASVKSWIFITPVILIGLGSPWPGPMILVVAAGIFSAKTFFQMVGIYHRSWFIWMTYLFILILGYLATLKDLFLINLMPMIFLGAISLIPLMRNSATHMIQYLALSLLSFIFWGWSLMHMGLLILQERGVFLVLYLILLTEVSDNVALATSRTIGRIKPFDRISHRVTLEGTLIAVVATLALAWGMRHLLPDRSEKFWIAAGLVAAIVGRLGGLILSVIRRDLGIKNTGVFIIGRDDILSRTDKLIFVGPLYYYIFHYLQHMS